MSTASSTSLHLTRQILVGRQWLPQSPGRVPTDWGHNRRKGWSETTKTRGHRKCCPSTPTRTCRCTRPRRGLRSFFCPPVLGSRKFLCVIPRFRLSSNGGPSYQEWRLSISARYTTYRLSLTVTSFPSLIRRGVTPDHRDPYWLSVFLPFLVQTFYACVSFCSALSEPSGSPVICFRVSVHTCVESLSLCPRVRLWVPPLLLLCVYHLGQEGKTPLIF